MKIEAIDITTWREIHIEYAVWFLPTMQVEGGVDITIHENEPAYFREMNAMNANIISPRSTIFI